MSGEIAFATNHPTPVDSFPANNNNIKSYDEDVIDFLTQCVKVLRFHVKYFLFRFFRLNLITYFF